MAFKFSREHVLKLDALHSTAKFKHRSGEQGDTCICVLRDKHMGKEWLRAEVVGGGPGGEERALKAVLAKAQPGNRPLTPAEQAEQLRRYREKYGDLDQPQTQPVPETPVPQAPVEASPEPPQGTGESMSVADIVQALRAAGHAVPEGDKRTGEWRAAALDLLKSTAANN